jgi:hypothetical protein
MQALGSSSRILPISACNLAPGRGLPTLRCRSHLLLPPCVSQHQHLVLTSQHLHKLSISVALAPCDSSCCSEGCLRLRYLQASNLAPRIGKSLPAFDLARNRHKFQHRLTHRHRTHKQSSTPFLLTLPCLPWWPELRNVKALRSW